MVSTEGVENMKILITGATGFLGSHLVKMVLKNGYEVVVVKRKLSDMWRLKDIKGNYNVYNIDEVSIDSIFECERNIGAVIHCATDYGRDGKPINKMLDSNVLFPVELLETAVNYKVKCFINTDSFFNVNLSIDEFLKENRYLSVYTLSKRHFNEWGRLIALHDNIKFINMKLEHVYGENDSLNKFVPSIIDKCIKNVPCIDLTNGEQSRDFIYVNDVVSAYLVILKSINTLGNENYYEFEIGKGHALKVKDFVKLIKEVTNSSSILNFGAIAKMQTEVEYSEANIHYLEKFGWKPLYNDEAGIREYISNEFLKGGYNGG